MLGSVTGKRCRAGGAGRKLACSDAVFGVGAWHEIMVNKGLYCTDHEIFLEFWEHLKQKVEVLESLKHEELTEKQLTSLKEMKSRLKQFDNADCQRIWRGRLCKTLGLGKFSVQKFTDLTPKQQEERILAHWQHFDWISSVIKWCILGIIQGLVADPTVFITNSEDTDIVLWDQVPKWVRAMPGTVMITECQKQQKQEGQKKRRLRGKQETSVETWEMHLQDHVSEIIKGPQGGSGSDKFRITTIMCQRIRHWFSEDKDPVGETLVTTAHFAVALMRARRRQCSSCTSGEISESKGCCRAARFRLQAFLRYTFGSKRTHIQQEPTCKDFIHC